MSDPSNIQLPCIHMNGTSANMLLRGYYPARKACRELEAKMSAIEFNERDYYPLGDDAWNKARIQFQEVFAKLKEIDDFLYQHVQHLVKAGGKMGG